MKTMPLSEVKRPLWQTFLKIRLAEKDLKTSLRDIGVCEWEELESSIGSLEATSKS